MGSVLIGTPKAFTNFSPGLAFRQPWDNGYVLIPMLKALARRLPRERLQRSGLSRAVPQGCANPGLKLVNAFGVQIRTLPS